jgi:hypothetical protein
MKDSNIPPTLLEIKKYDGLGFQPQINSLHWRVAILNFTHTLTQENIDEFQRHDETDEVFILLRGHCILFIGEGDDIITRLFAQNLEPFTLYNVKRHVWHTHVLSPDAKVLLVENQDTASTNSPRLKLTPTQQAELLSLTRLMWGEQ